MTKRFNYLILSQQSWDTEIGSNAKNIAMQISKDNKVLYVNRPLDVLTRIKTSNRDESVLKRKSLRGKSIVTQIDEVEPNLFSFTPKRTLLSINFLPEGKVYDWALRYNNSLLANEILEALKFLKMEDYILINDGELFNGLHLNEMLNPSRSVYYYRDNFLAVPYWQKHGRRIEPMILKKYDRVVCNSEYLVDLALEHNPLSTFVGQGCDYAIFDEIKPKTIDLHATSKPIIGYVGALNSFRLDVELLEQLTAKNPQWDWHFVGPEDDAFQKSIMHQMPHVTFTGPKPQNELGFHINQFDVAINPQRINEVTIGNYPRKIDEYLYLGKPTVATKTRAMDMFKNHCFLTQGVEGYESAIKMALLSNSSDLAEERKSFASQHSWENSVNKIYQTLAS